MHKDTFALIYHKEDTGDNFYLFTEEAIEEALESLIQAQKRKLGIITNTTGDDAIEEIAEASDWQNFIEVFWLTCDETTIFT